MAKEKRKFSDRNNKEIIPDILIDEDGVAEDTNTYNANAINKLIGQIIETGSNSNGSWIKFSNGIMICWQNIEGTTTFQTSWGNLYHSSLLSFPDFPQNFVEIPRIFMSNHRTQSSLMPAGDPSITKAEEFVLVRPNSAGASWYSADCLSIGKWK